MPRVDEIFTDILSLKSTDKLQLVDKILASIYPDNQGTKAMWAHEAEDRIEAHSGGHIETIDEKDILMKYER